MTTRATSGRFWQVEAVEEVELLRGGFAQRVEAALSCMSGVLLDAGEQAQSGTRTGAMPLGLQAHAHDAPEDKCKIRFGN